jgi:hydrogenase maturation protein HypF
MDRRSIAVSGIVQGVGFRPFVYGLASRFGLHGYVKNHSGGVLIEVEGDDRSLDRFLSELTSRPPPLARIEAVHWESCHPEGALGFRIEPSSADAPERNRVFPAADVAPCGACLAELFDLHDRRYRYPFLNCTHCGPRLTIIRGTPYDRERTTMASFTMCADCRAEYEDPGTRRFHAQPIACPVCGPRLQARDAQGRPIATDDPMAEAIAVLRQGKIVALKGLGGYHLACVAGNDAAVGTLRRRKHRDEKPLALMVYDLAAARRLTEVSPAEEGLLVSPRRPIVLLRRAAAAASVVAEAVAPRNPFLGVMLPYTPLHYLLLAALDPLPLVMTSGNRTDEPIAYEDQDALSRLVGIADLFLTHDRPIETRCDDSVTRVIAGTEVPLRRSRGIAPEPIALPVPCSRPLLAVGGQMKVTFALGRDRHAILSHHIGDLDHYEAYRSLVAAIRHYERLFAIRPEVIVHDLHPDYASTRYAHERSETDGLELMAVQHHHAHIASCMAEHCLDEPVIGVAFDGTGYGSDGTVWGGEFLQGDYRGFRRAAHLRNVAMPGGEQVIREPWRMAAAYLADAGLDDALLRGRDGISSPALEGVQRMIERRLNAPLTSSAGRLFDAVAALAGVRNRIRFEGQAAMELEWLATEERVDGAYAFALEEPPDGDSSLVVDTRPLVTEVAAEVRRGCPGASIARRFQTTMAEIVVLVCTRLATASGLVKVVLSGGVFLNELLTRETTARLAQAGFQVYRHQQVPPGDGGLCLGQLAIAAARHGKCLSEPSNPTPT